MRATLRRLGLGRRRVTAAPVYLARVLHSLSYTTGARAMLTRRIPSPACFVVILAAVATSATCGALAGIAAGYTLAFSFAAMVKNA